MWSAMTTGSSAGRSFHRSNCQAARVAPPMKPPRVSRIDVCPEPTAKRVPEAQAPPSCMPTAKTNEPISSPTPRGPAEGAGTEPNSPVPVPMIRANSVAVVPSRRAWARRPAPLPTAISCRQAEVKPKRSGTGRCPGRGRAAAGRRAWPRGWSTHRRSVPRRAARTPRGGRGAPAAREVRGRGTEVGDGDSSAAVFAAWGDGAMVTGGLREVRVGVGHDTCGRPGRGTPRPGGGVRRGTGRYGSAATEAVVDAPRRVRHQGEAEQAGGCGHGSRI